jgi:DNA-binding Lrp family transcriptional regulator
MQRPNLAFPTLTKNEQRVLKSIIDRAKIPDLEIAAKMGLSQQAIFKIRHKLEEVGIIEGYMPIINYKKIGIEALVVLCVKFTPRAWAAYSEEELNERIQKIPHVLTAYRVPDSRISHIFIMGFRDIEHKDRYLMKLQSKYAEEIEVVHSYPFSVDRIIKSNHIGLLKAILDATETFTDDFLPAK